MLDPRAALDPAAAAKKTEEDPALVLLQESCRAWIRTTHGAEPKRKKVKKSQGFTSMFSINKTPDVWEYEVVSEEKLLEERVRDLTAAVSSCDQLLQLPVFSLNQHGELPAMRRV